MIKHLAEYSFARDEGIVFINIIVDITEIMYNKRDLNKFHAYSFDFM